MKEKYFIKYGNLYLQELDLDEDSICTEFISNIKFRSDTLCCDNYDIDKAHFIIDKLVTLGFDQELFILEKVKENDNN